MPTKKDKYFIFFCDAYTYLVFSLVENGSEITPHLNGFPSHRNVLLNILAAYPMTQTKIIYVAFNSIAKCEGHNTSTAWLWCGVSESF